MSTLPLDEARARASLGKATGRLGDGARRVALGAVAAFALGRVVAFAYMVPAGAGLADLGPVLYEACMLAAIAWVAMPPLIRRLYRALIERGRLVEVEVIEGPQRVGKGLLASITPSVVGWWLDGLFTLLKAWVPTRVVHFRRCDGETTRLTGALYGDEMLPPGERDWALVDPLNPRRAWLVRERSP